MIAQVDNADEKLSGEKPVWVIKPAKLIQGGTIPRDFPLIIDDTNGMVCQPCHFYLYDRYVNNVKGTFVKETVNSYARDLRQWMEYLTEFSVPWNEATEFHLQAYVDVMEVTVSPHTKRDYREKTKTHHKGVIEGMYRWMGDRYPWLFPRSGQLYLHTPRSHPVSVKVSKDDFGQSARTVFLQRDEAASLFNALGRLPCSGQSVPFDANGPTEWRSVMRLAGETAINAGLRLAELVGLKLQQFEQFRARKVAPNSAATIQVFGKGRKVRGVHFHGVLLEWILNYIDGERALALDGAPEHGKLLVNASGHRRGQPLSKRTIQRAFAKACITVGLIKTGTVRHPVEDDWSELTDNIELRPKFTFHALRHTFAIWTYYARKAAGDSEPWMYIQGQLGHSELITTLKTYLDAVRDFEPYVSDVLMKGLLDDAGLLT